MTSNGFTDRRGGRAMSLTQQPELEAAPGH